MTRTQVQILERIIAAIPIMLGVVICAFLFMRMIPGDPVDIMMGEAGGVTLEEIESLRAEFDLDKPIHVQLTRYLGRLVRGDMGYSIQRSRPVREIIFEAIPATIELAMFALLR